MRPHAHLPAKNTRGCHGECAARAQSTLSTHINLTRAAMRQKRCERRPTTAGRRGIAAATRARGRRMSARGAAAVNACARETWWAPRVSAMVEVRVRVLWSSLKSPPEKCVHTLSYGVRCRAKERALSVQTRGLKVAFQRDVRCSSLERRECGWLREKAARFWRQKKSEWAAELLSCSR